MLIESFGNRSQFLHNTFFKIHSGFSNVSLNPDTTSKENLAESICHALVSCLDNHYFFGLNKDPLDIMILKQTYQQRKNASSKSEVTAFFEFLKNNRESFSSSACGSIRGILNLIFSSKIDQKIAWLHYSEKNITHSEIANQVGIERSIITKRLQKIKKKMGTLKTSSVKGNLQ